MNREFPDLLKKAREFHGHLCPYLVLGLRASIIAMKKLEISKTDIEETISEEKLAIVEVNNCFADGVQVATGCTFGNNSMIYIDTGKNAVTLVKRGSWKGVRVYIDAEKLRERYFPEEAVKLFEIVIIRREGNSKDINRIHKLWTELAYKMLEIPEDEFKVERVKVRPLEKAPIFKSVRCSRCGELVMETRAIYVNGEPLCPVCAGTRSKAVIGRGIIADLSYPIEPIRG